MVKTFSTGRQILQNYKNFDLLYKYSSKKFAQTEHHEAIWFVKD